MLISDILCRLVCLRIQETTLYMVFYVFKAVSEGTMLAVTSGSSEEESVLSSHVLPSLLQFEPLFTSNHCLACKRKHKLCLRMLVMMTMFIPSYSCAWREIQKGICGLTTKTQSCCCYTKTHQKHNLQQKIQKHASSINLDTIRYS